MTAQLRPEDPKFQTASEEEVWTRLRDTLPDDAVLIAGLRITDEEKDHEADLVVLLPQVGIVVLEVKGGSVSYDGEVWSQRSKGGKKRIDPVEQVRTTKYAIRDYVAGDPRWDRRRHVAWAHGVVAPYSGFPDDFAAPDCPRWAVHGRDDTVRFTVRGRGIGTDYEDAHDRPSSPASIASSTTSQV